MLRNLCRSAAALTLLACSSTPVPDTPPTSTGPKAIIVTAPTTAMVVGATLQLKAEVRDSAGRSLPAAMVGWSVDRATVATVSASGQVVALAPGQAVVTASDGPATSATLISVYAETTDEPASVVLSLAVDTLGPGESVPVGVTVLSAKNVAVPGARITWTTDNPAVANVAFNGIVTAVTPGRATITATSGVATASVSILVSTIAVVSVTASGPAVMALGQNSQLSAVVTGANGAQHIGTVLWSSSNTGIVTVTTTGLAQAIGIGTATITATADGKHAVLTISVNPPALLITPQNIQVAIGDSLKLSAWPYDTHLGLTGGPVQATWTSSDPQVITVNQDGWVFGHGTVNSGQTYVIASVGSVVGQLLVAVTAMKPGLPAGIRVVHAASDLGTVTFKPSTTAPASLVFGEVRELIARSGNVQVTVDGFAPPPPGTQAGFQLGQLFAGLLPPGEHLTLYAAGDNPYGVLVGLWDRHDEILPDAVLVRILYASNFARTYVGNNLYLLGTGAPIDAHPLLCYVDAAGESTEYVSRDAGEYDIVLVDPGNFVLTAPNYGTELKRFHVKPRAGHATTYVITGKDPATMSLLTVEDP